MISIPCRLYIFNIYHLIARNSTPDVSPLRIQLVAVDFKSYGATVASRSRPLLTIEFATKPDAFISAMNARR